MTDITSLALAALACGFTALFTAIGYSAALTRAKTAHEQTYRALRRTRKELMSVRSHFGGVR